MKSRSIEPNMKDFLELWYSEAGLENVPKNFARTMPQLPYDSMEQVYQEQ